jgi:hypothetical protein
MRTGLHAKGAASAVKNTLNLSGDAIAVSAVLPVEGQEVVVLPIEDHVIESCVSHKVLPYQTDIRIVLYHNLPCLSMKTRHKV